MVLVQGEAVLPGTVEAPLSKVSPMPGTVYACNLLTVDEVRRALHSDVVGLVTVGGNFASHAANILRSAQRRGVNVPWVRSIDVGDERRIRISPDGRCDFDGDGARRVEDAADLSDDLFVYTAGSTRWHRVCLWPHRPYLDAEFELMKTGLRRSASSLAGHEVSVELRDRKIWFGTATPTSRDLSALAMDPAFSMPHLREMAEDYTFIIESIKAGDFSPEIPERFFSTFLPFHKSYPAVIKHIAARAGASADNVAAHALVNGIVRWLDMTPEFTSASKVPGDAMWIGRLPPGEPDFYIGQAVDELTAVSPDMARADIEWLANLVVVKELKMIIAKNIYAIFLKALD